MLNMPKAARHEYYSSLGSDKQLIPKVQQALPITSASVCSQTTDLIAQSEEIFRHPGLSEDRDEHDMN